VTLWLSNLFDCIDQSGHQEFNGKGECSAVVAAARANVVSEPPERLAFARNIRPELWRSPP
jgi:hypothetical protein